MPPSRQVLSLAVLPNGLLACGTYDEKVIVIDMSGEIKRSNALGGAVRA